MYGKRGQTPHRVILILQFALEGPLLTFSFNCAGQSAYGIVKGLFTKTTTVHGTREPIRSLIRITSNGLRETLFVTSQC